MGKCEAVICVVGSKIFYDNETYVIKNLNRGSCGFNKERARERERKKNQKKAAVGEGNKFKK